MAGHLVAGFRLPHVREPLFADIHCPGAPGMKEAPCGRIQQGQRLAGDPSELAFALKAGDTGDEQLGIGM